MDQRVDAFNECPFVTGTAPQTGALRTSLGADMDAIRAMGLEARDADSESLQMMGDAGRVWTRVGAQHRSTAPCASS